MMHCPECRKDVHPVIDGDQNMKFVYRCPCGSYLGDVVREASGVPSAPSPAAVPARTLSVSVSPPPSVPVVDQILARLHYLEDGHVEAEIAERRSLRRMLAAAERKPRQKTNVVPMRATR
jgi:hypothetical protein